jgi:hypothetical protein
MFFKFLKTNRIFPDLPVSFECDVFWLKQTFIHSANERFGSVVLMDGAFFEKGQLFSHLPNKNLKERPENYVATRRS